MRDHAFCSAMRDCSAESDNVIDNFEQLYRHYSPETICKIISMIIFGKIICKKNAIFIRKLLSLQRINIDCSYEHCDKRQHYPYSPRLFCYAAYF